VFVLVCSVSVSSEMLSGVLVYMCVLSFSCIRVCVCVSSFSCVCLQFLHTSKNSVLVTRCICSVCVLPLMYVFVNLYLCELRKKC